MMDLARSVSKDIFTGVDGQSYDVARIAGFIAILVYLAMGIRGVSVSTADHPFDFQAFGIGFGAMCTGVGALIKLKESTEPKAAPNEPQ